MSDGMDMCQVVILASASRPNPSTLLQILPSNVKCKEKCLVLEEGGARGEEERKSVARGKEKKSIL